MSGRNSSAQSTRVPPNGLTVGGLSEHLHKTLHGKAVVLDDRRVPGAKAVLNHIVVAPSGVWVDGLDRHVIGVESLLAQAGLTSVPVHAALCFVNAEWGWFAKPFSLSGVWVAWPEKLTELVLEWRAIPDTEFDTLARAVAARLAS